MHFGTKNVEIVQDLEKKEEEFLARKSLNMIHYLITFYLHKYSAISIWDSFWGEQKCH